MSCDGSLEMGTGLAPKRVVSANTRPVTAASKDALPVPGMGRGRPVVPQPPSWGAGGR